MLNLLAALPLLFPPTAPGLIKRIDGGEIVVEMTRGPDGFPKGTALGVLGAPIDKAFATLTDFGRYSQYYTGIPKSQVRRQSGSESQVYLVIDFPWPMADRWALLEFKVDEPGRKFEWRRIGGTVRRYEGEARFAPWPGNRTVMEFDAMIDPGFAFLPQWLLGYFTAQSLPGVVSGPRDYLIRTAKAGN